MTETLNEVLHDRISFVTAIEVPEDGVIVLKARRKITQEQAEAFQSEVSEILPGRRVLILPLDLDIDVLVETQEDST